MWAGDFMRVNAELRQLLGQVLRMDALRGDGPVFHLPNGRHVELIADASTVDRLGGMAGKPAYYVTPKTRLA